MVKNFFFRGITLDTLSFTSTTIATPLTPHRGGWLCDKYMYIQNPCCVIGSMIPLYYPYTALIILHWEAMGAIKAHFTKEGTNYDHIQWILASMKSKLPTETYLKSRCRLSSKLRSLYERNLGLNIIISSRIQTVHLNVFLPRSPLCIHPRVVLSKYL